MCHVTLLENAHTVVFAQVQCEQKVVLAIWRSDFKFPRLAQCLNIRIKNYKRVVSSNFTKDKNFPF